jgi:antitoxin YefM
MRIVSFSDARSNLKDMLDTVVNDRSIIVVRRRGHDDAVVISLTNYKSMADTMHLLSTKANRDHLTRSIAQFRGHPSR